MNRCLGVSVLGIALIVSTLCVESQAQRRGGGGGGRGAAMARGGGGGRPNFSHSPSMSRVPSRPAPSRPTARPAPSRPTTRPAPSRPNLSGQRPNPSIQRPQNRPSQGLGQTARPQPGRNNPPSRDQLQGFLNLPQGGAARPNNPAQSRPGARPSRPQSPNIDAGKIRQSIGQSPGRRPDMPEWFKPGATPGNRPTTLPGNARPRPGGGDSNRPINPDRPNRPGDGDRPNVRPPGDGDRPGRPPGGGDRPDVRPPVERPPGYRPPPGQRPPGYRPPGYRPPNARPYPPRYPWYPNHPGYNDFNRGYWWGAATVVGINTWLSPAWSQPTYYSYGSGGSVYYEDNNVYVDGSQYATAEEYYTQASDIAASGQSTSEEPSDADWMPLGVFALTEEGVSSSSMYLQLAISKEAVLAGTFYNETTGDTHPVEGMVDEESQRAAWRAADGTNSDLVMETGVYNLTKDESDVLVHFGPDETQVWKMVRLSESDRPESMPE